MSDYENFWELIQEEVSGKEVKEKLQKIKLKLMNPKPRHPAAHRRRETGPLVGADQGSGLHQETQSLLSRLTEWRKRCQQREAARRLCQGQGVNKMVQKTNEKASRSKMYLSRLYQMYSTSLTNMVFSRRLLEKDDRFADVYAERRAGGLLDYMVPSGHRQQPEALSRETGAEDPSPTMQQPRVQPALRFLKCQSPADPQRGFSKKAEGHQVALGGMSNMKGRSVPAVVAVAPLTLEHLIQTHPVLEVKTVRRYWVNYVDEE